MDKMARNRMGLAGELRVMSELLLRGYNPAKSYLEDGTDIILGNGLRIEVKSGHRCQAVYYTGTRQKYRKKNHYVFQLNGGRRLTPDVLTNNDFVILWCMDDDCFFILPTQALTTLTIGICNVSDGSKSKYMPYKNKWDLLGGNNERI